MDLLSPAVVENPYPAFRELREYEPAHWSNEHNAWLITRFEDVIRGYKDPRLSSAHISNLFQGPQDAPSQKILDGWMEFRDPPDHTRLRKLVQKAFTPKVVESLKPRIQEIANDLIKSLNPQTPEDLVKHFAYPLPAIVIGEMLGVPSTDREQFQIWSNEIKNLIFGIGDERERRVTARKGLFELRKYFEGILSELHNNPRDGLLNSLVEAKEANEKLTADEIIGTCVLLLFAGHETTTNLIANGILALSKQPQDVRNMFSDQENSSRVVEEVLRFEGPLKLMVRSAKTSLSLKGQRVRKSDRVFLIQASANRDERQYEDPDKFWPSRKDRPHLAFGHGIHFCLGAPLARIEGQIALGELFTRFPRLKVDTHKPSWEASILSRSLKELPTILEPQEE